MRVIIRFSVSGVGDLRNKLAGHLMCNGFQKTGTATWEAGSIKEDDLSHVLAEFWRRVADHKSPDRLDHFWMYADNVDGSPMSQDQNAESGKIETL